MHRRSSSNLAASIFVWTVVLVIVWFRAVVFAILGWMLVAFLATVAVAVLFVKEDRNEQKGMTAVGYWDAEFNVDPD